MGLLRRARDGVATTKRHAPARRLRAGADRLKSSVRVVAAGPKVRAARHRRLKGKCEVSFYERALPVLLGVDPRKALEQQRFIRIALAPLGL